MKVVLSRQVSGTFLAQNEAGAIVRMEGPADLGGTGESMKPMEVVLSALAGSSAVDVMKILRHQKVGVSDLKIVVEGKRTESIPAVFEEIHVVFEISGPAGEPIDEVKAKKAVSLSMQKYCSVVKMLELSVHITHDVIVHPST